MINGQKIYIDSSWETSIIGLSVASSRWGFAKVHCKDESINRNPNLVHRTADDNNSDGESWRALSSPSYYHHSITLSIDLKAISSIFLRIFSSHRILVNDAFIVFAVKKKPQVRSIWNRAKPIGDCLILIQTKIQPLFEGLSLNTASKILTEKLRRPLKRYWLAWKLVHSLTNNFSKWSVSPTSSYYRSASGPAMWV